MSETPIPYAGAHRGPTRVLRLHTRRGIIAKAGITVGIDDAHYHRPWGWTAFEIPADRPVHVTVSQGDGQIGAATSELTPEQPSDLEYRGPAALYLAGSIGPPGTVKQRGCLLQLALFTLLPLLALTLLILLSLLLTQ